MSDNLISLEDLAKAAEEALEGDEVSGFAKGENYGITGMRFLNSLTSIKGGPLAPGCCTQGCCEDDAALMFKR